MKALAPERDEPGDHPEDTCYDCGRSNFEWWVAGDRWLLAVGGPNGPVLCPRCFVRRWEAATGMTCMWQLVPDDRTIRSRRAALPDLATPPSQALVCAEGGDAEVLREWQHARQAEDAEKVAARYCGDKEKDTTMLCGLDQCAALARATITDAGPVRD